MAREEPNETVRRLAGLARDVDKATPGKQMTAKFPLLQQVMYVKVEMLAGDEMFVQVGNDAVGPLFADRVAIDAPAYQVVADVVGTALEHYILRETRRALRPEGRVELEDPEVESLPAANRETDDE